MFAYALRLVLFALPFVASSLSVHADEGWPRTFESAQGNVVISQQPKRIISTSVTLTGSLLAINAPVIGSGATMPGHKLTDEQGFFRQWSNVAQARKVKKLYAGEPDLETIAAENPDLIVVSATGNDSALGFVDRLSALAPTLVINYDDKSWQEVERVLARATGHEAEAGKIIAEYSRREAAVKATITLPPQPVSALVYNPGSQVVSIWTESSAQGKLLEALGFQLATPPPQLFMANLRLKRRDILTVKGESLVYGITGQTALLFATDDSGKTRFMADPLLANSPAVQDQQVYSMGMDSFRLDYYSANHLLTRLESLFAAK